MKSGSLKIWRDLLYTNYTLHVNGFSQMLFCTAKVAHNSGIYNVGTDNPVTIDEQIHAIIDVLPPKDALLLVICRTDEISRGGFLLDIEKAKTELGYVPQYNYHQLFEDCKEEMKIKSFTQLNVEYYG